MKNKKFYSVVSLLAILALLLSACSSSSSSGDKKDKAINKEELSSKFPTTVKNSKKAIDGGVLNYGIVSDTPFEGTFNLAFYSGQPDFEVIKFFEESLLKTNKNYEITNGGAANYKLSNANKTITIKIKDNVNWSDGKPVTAEDLEFAYLVIGNKDYTGVRYGDPLMQNIVGMDAYHSGKADKISGIKVIDDKTISITWKSANPSVLTGIWTNPLPKHYLKDVPIKKMAQSDKIRKNPIGFGPFKVKKVVPGESVELVRNDDYWAGKPKLKGVVIKVVNPKVIVQSMKKGEIDYAMFPVDQYTAAKNAKNFQLLGTIDLAYSYIGFKLGHWDAKKQENVMDNPKFQNKKLRQAMAYALDNKSVGEKIYNGLRFPATGLIPPSFPGYYDENARGITYDVKKAKKLLDEAGYKDVDKDGYREDPNGKKFTINFLSMSGGDTAEPLAKFYIQCWKNVGLNVKLVDGRLAEFNSFYDMIEKDDPKVDVYSAAWGTGSDVDPSSLYGRNAMFNYSRFVSKKNDELLEKGHAPESFDKEHRRKIYNQWQEYMNEEVPVIPTLYRYQLYAVNDRVKNLAVYPAESDTDWSKVSVTSEKPATENE
ncbi:oligopeptide ABC transporter substrate-binding protein [Heyndrickxia acidiproducens]|uniref:oligopeptide ABC transporter substrate-binding protein n=1 Tax=Heyndrickxia acidiproducens TaxID=1121084 RepID=UPI00036017DC|nr:oligopeptide ABC transporter substrate-binding protein [Heyndrickxia acidiproducens]